MNRKQRITHVASGLFMILLALIMVLFSEIGYEVITLILAVTFIVRGIQSILYYYSMARFTVGGRIILYQGVITLDFGLVNLILSNVPKEFLMIYLVSCFGFAGLVVFLRSLEAKKMDAPLWKWKMTNAIIHLIIVVICLIFIGRVESVVYIYAAGLTYSALARIAQAFQKTEAVYIA